MSRKSMTTEYALVHWTARVLGALAFLLWGLFLIEHLTEWFGDASENLPPVQIVLMIVLHSLMVFSFLLIFKWEIAGGIMSVVFTLAFFLSLEVLIPMLLTLIPGIVSIIAGVYKKTVIKGVCNE